MHFLTNVLLHICNGGYTKKGGKLEKKTCLNTDISKPLQMNLK